MRKRWTLMLAVCLVGSVAGCGDDAVSSSTPESAASTPDPVDATMCADLADRYVEITRIIVDRLGERTDAEMETPPEDLEAAADEWFQASSDLIPRIAELCDEGEFDSLLCDRKFVIEPAGEAGARFLSDNYPSCSDEPRQPTTLPSGG
jgi:hypothetical protein